MELADVTSHVLRPIVAEHVEFLVVGAQDHAIGVHPTQPDIGVVEQVRELRLARARGGVGGATCRDVAEHEHASTHLSRRIDDRRGAVLDRELAPVGQEQRRRSCEMDDAPLRHGAPHRKLHGAPHPLDDQAHHMFHVAVETLIDRAPEHPFGHAVHALDGTGAIGHDHRITDAHQRQAQLLAARLGLAAQRLAQRLGVAEQCILSHDIAPRPMERLGEDADADTNQRKDDDADAIAGTREIERSQWFDEEVLRGERAGRGGHYAGTPPPEPRRRHDAGEEGEVGEFEAQHRGEQPANGGRGGDACECDHQAHHRGVARRVDRPGQPDGERVR